MDFFINEKYNFFDTTNDDYLSKMAKLRDLKIRKIKPKKDDWVNFRNEYGDIWYKIEETYEPDDYFASVYFYDHKQEKKIRYYKEIRNISKEIQDDVKLIDIDGVFYSKKNYIQYKLNKKTQEYNL